MNLDQVFKHIKVEERKFEYMPFRASINWRGPVPLQIHGDSEREVVEDLKNLVESLVETWEGIVKKDHGWEKSVHEDAQKRLDLLAKLT